MKTSTRTGRLDLHHFRCLVELVEQGSTKRAFDPGTYNGRWTISAPE